MVTQNSLPRFRAIATAAALLTLAGPTLSAKDQRCRLAAAAGAASSIPIARAVVMRRVVARLEDVELVALEDKTQRVILGDERDGAMVVLLVVLERVSNP